MGSRNSAEGRVIWVTGGAGHLGSALTGSLDADGATVVCIDLEGKAADLVRKQKLTRTLAIDCDLTKVAELPGLVDRLVREQGVPDGLVHLAFASSSGKRLEALSAEDFQATLDSALTPAFVLSRAAAERMKARGSGSVVLFGSMYGMVSPDPGIYRAPLAPNPIDYGASKAAIAQITRYLAVHYGPAGIRFNCIVPGPFPAPAVQTAQPEFIQALSRKTPLGRIGSSREIVGPALFLLGDDASYVTGHCLVVDGGWTAW
jgi:NAD(P)-dependent dehydrogenase (short-subunit alcohol dehydrogenase family)